ncbi:hypothetical protein A5727_00815 [Mycobacterium sp. ACS4331]|nr:hypothetical protein A5727_00815 [Mycobacterium sp. ACS4331]
MVATAVTVAQVTPAPSAPVDLLVQRVMAMGGNGRPDGDNMLDELNGYFDPASVNYGLCDARPDCAMDSYGVISWNAKVWRPDSAFDAQQADGVRSLDTALRDALKETTPDDDIVVVGYSSSASVVVRYLRQLHSQALAGEDVPNPDQVRFLAIGSPNRPNGGLFARFPGLRIPILGVTTDGANTETGYQLTDISWKYDLISDFPTYPLNLVALANAALGFFYLHSYYYEADPHDGQLLVSDPKWTGAKAGELTDYITLAPRHLPLLQPFYDAGVPSRLLDAIEPLLTEIVELGYDRETPVWQPTPAKLLPRPGLIFRALPKLVAALEKGLRILVGRPPAVARTVSVDPARTAPEVQPQRAAKELWPSTLKRTELGADRAARRASTARATQKLKAAVSGAVDRVRDGLRRAGSGFTFKPRVQTRTESGRESQNAPSAADAAA